ncbi:hypothetical protein QBC34DRAFT_144548 [Podospora aff. communis PSN243]|uniref:C2H2-type domain-containing protein n=1 Tax=Podospora aff. communis PSN243 TaxID=3040156 RepID=A0AAV9GES8_9PEZI|nr:hypothetical protein QBC34DRAFT_144548 [Podospora aff. communis PSN243]
MSDVTSNKRFSASTIATTLTMAASSETLHGQFKRIRPDSRSSSYRSGSIPSARSSAHASASHGLRCKAQPLAPRDAGFGSDGQQPPIPAVPRWSFHNQLDADDSPLPTPPKSVLEAGVLAQERRGKQTGSIQDSAGSAEVIEEHQICSSTETGDCILSVINEHMSDAGSAMIATPRPSTDRRPEAHDLPNESIHGRQSSEGPSIFSRGTSPLESSATSLGDLLERDQPSQESSDIEETMSDVTDHTDLSLIEAFEAWPARFDPALLSLLVSLKEEVVRRIKQRLQAIILQAQETQQSPTTSGSRQTQASTESAGRPEFLSALPTLRKRAFERDDEDPPGRGDEEDSEKRKRKDTTPQAQLKDRLKKFACPYYKRYPSSDKLSKSCHAPGWDSVHRVKEHIYRRHQRPPFRCPRCFEAFDNEDKLLEHQRAAVICETSAVQLEEETIYISKSQELELRKRKRETSEEEKWHNIFRILFPQVPSEQMPSPYHEASLQAHSLSSASVELGQFRHFLREVLPTRVISDLNNHLQVQLPGFTLPGHLTHVIRGTIQEVMEDFRPLLVPISPGANGSARNSPLILDTPPARIRTHAERQTAESHTRGIFLRPNEGRIFPPPSRVAPPPPVPQWDLPVLSESPSASTFNFGFTYFDTPAIPPVDEVSELWVLDEDYNTGLPSFEEYLNNGRTSGGMGS